MVKFRQFVSISAWRRERFDEMKLTNAAHHRVDGATAGLDMIPAHDLKRSI